MKIFLGILSVLFWSGLPFFDTPFAPDANLGTAVPLHLLETVTTRTDKETKEVDLRELLDGNVHFLGGTLGSFLLMILNGRTEVRVVFHGTVDKANALIFQLLTITNFPRVCPSTMRIIGRGRGWRSMLTVSLCK